MLIYKVVTKIIDHNFGSNIYVIPNTYHIFIRNLLSGLSYFLFFWSFLTYTIITNITKYDIDYICVQYMSLSLSHGHVA